jgi:hypothetical protein
MLHTLLASVLSLAAAQQSTPGAPPTPVAPAPAATPAPPAAPGGSADPSATRRAPNPQVAAILARSLMPAPHVARMERALAIAGLGDRFSKEAVTAAAANAKAGYDAWRATAEPALAESIRAAVDADPGLGFPRRCKAQISAAWDEAAAFERDAFAALIASALPEGDAAGSLARAALAAGQAQALRSTRCSKPTKKAKPTHWFTWTGTCQTRMAWLRPSRFWNSAWQKCPASSSSAPASVKKCCAACSTPAYALC